MPGAVADHLRRPLHHIPFLLAGQVTGRFVVITMAGDLVSPIDDGFHRLRKTLGDAAAGVEGDLDLLFLEDAQNTPDPGMRAILTLGPFLMIHCAVGERAYVLAALKVERQHHGAAIALRPEKLAVVVMVSQHESILSNLSLG